MRTILNDVAAPAHDSYVDRKSEFLGDAIHAADETEALAFVAAIRERHPKARHVAFAAVFGGDGTAQSERMSDDGEPSGTAGKPILDVLRQSGVTDTVIAVTRYFGGILLGSGGLVRAYSSAASMAMKTARVARIMTARRYRVRLDYPQLARFQQILAQIDGRQEAEEYAADIRLTAVVPAERTGRFEERVRETFNAAVTPEPVDMVNIPVPLD